MKNGLEFITTLNLHLPSEQAVSVLGTYPRERKRCVHRKSLSHNGCSSQPEGPSTREWINGDVFIQWDPTHKRTADAHPAWMTHKHQAKGKRPDTNNYI